MAFRPTKSPLYGGDMVTVRLEEEDPLQLALVSHFLVFQGSRRRHVVPAHLDQGEGCLFACIPGHDHAEEVELTLVRLEQELSATGTYQPVASTAFRYECDTTVYLTKFLTSSVYNDHALDNLELIKSDRFDLSNEVLSTLDARVSRALKNAELTTCWHLLGGDSITDSHCEERETLLHFCARLGLIQVAQFLLQQPGAEDALQLPNRHGELPYVIAQQNGFQDLAEMLSGYNTQGMGTSEPEVLEIGSAVLRNLGDGSLSLTSFLDSPNLDRTVENEIDFLRETEEMIKVQRGFSPISHCNSDWPNLNLQQTTVASKSLPSLPLESEVEESLGRLLHKQQQHGHNIRDFLHAASGHAYTNSGDDNGGQRHLLYSNSFDDAGRSIIVNDRGQGQGFDPGSSDGKGQDAEHWNNHGGGYYPVLENTLSGVRELSEGLFELRDTYRHQRKDVRRRHFSRFSSSCPSLQDPPPILPPIEENDHHKSMHDLLEEVVPSVGPSNTSQGDQHSPTSSSPHLDHPPGTSPADTGVDQAIRICINGVTVDSTKDFPGVSSAHSRDGKEQRMDLLTGPRRGSWNVNSSGGVKGSAVPLDRTDQTTRVRMLAMTGKSLSLNSLDGEEEEEEEEAEEEEAFMAGGARGAQLHGSHAWSMEEPRKKERSLFSTPSLPSDLLGPDVDTGQLSPVDSDRSSPTGRDISDAIPFSKTKGGGSLGSDDDGGGGDLGVSPINAKSMSDLTSSASDRTAAMSTSGLHTLAKRHTFEEGQTGLGVPQASITKSLSTPSIPQATKQGGESSYGGRTDGKHRPEKDLLLSLAQDYDAFLSRQKEIEEVDEEENVTHDGKDRKAEISLKAFLSEEQSPNDSDEKSTPPKPGARKEEKRRKPSVFSRFQSSYRTKKNKEKEIKSKDGHRFVSVSFSNSSLCHVCRKSMANKAALRCENCLMNVHENCCKDLKSWCEKSRPPKALQRDGSSHGAHGQPTQQRASSLRPSNSFKDKRSYSAPVKPPQTSSTSSSSQLPTPVPSMAHRHSLPSSSYSALFGSPPSNSSLSGAGAWPPTTTMGRFSLLDKAISEETESDSGGAVTGMDPIGTNMMETNSESVESLDAVSPGEVSSLDDEPDLQLLVDEHEAWNITVDKKVLKKMNAKDIKRQDTIWELIQTEKQYVRKLKIMQKIFAHNMLEHQNFTIDQVDRLFPRLDELVELHANFLRSLLARQSCSEDRAIEEIGDLLLAQFQDVTADKMKSVYGVFCSKHTEAMQLYKDIIRTDRKFQTFVKNCINMSICEKRDISDFILGVTVRLAKYPILIEAILKCTKDKKDRESISQALILSKDVVQHVDSKVAAYMKLVDIQTRVESRAVMYRGKKFKRQDLTAGNRELLHSGKIGWRNARGRVYDVIALVLTDVIVFLQKNEQKFSFLMQDNKSCVIPLFRLLVREKNDSKDSRGIFLISQNRSTPEMYELTCQSKAEREVWIGRLMDAIRCCPAEIEVDEQDRMATQVAALSLEEDRRREERANHIDFIIQKLHQQDSVIKQCCDEKTKLMYALMEVSSSARSDNGSRPNSQEIVCVNESIEIVQAAMQEASRLTVILQGSGTHLSRSVSSVGEHVSHSYVATPIPKRAETFAGFDSNHENQASPKLSVMKQRYIQPESEEDEVGQSVSDVSLDQPELMDSGHVDAADDLTPVVESPSQKEFGPSSMSNVPSPLQHSSHSHLWEEPGSGAHSDRSSDGRGSLDELISAASISPLLPSPSPTNNVEQMTSIVHLVQYLNSLMNITSKQNTKVESLRVELEEAKKEISKLSVDMQGRRTVYRHDQLEELRNLQENISREKQEWERTKSKDRAVLEMERKKLDEEKREIDKEKAELRSRKENLKRERETLQVQIDMMKEQGYQVFSPLLDPPQGVRASTDSVMPQQRPVAHRRSASADFYSTVDVKDVEAMENYNPEAEVHGAGLRPTGFPRQGRLSVGSLQGQQTGHAYGLPMHLLSARNEQRMGGANVQRLPLKLAGSTNNNGPQQAAANVVPSKSFAAGIQQPFPSRSASGITRVQSMSASSRPQASTTGQMGSAENSRSAPSNLSRLMKLADPKGGKSTSPSGPTHKPPIPQGGKSSGGGPAPGAPASKSESEDQGQVKPESVIYF